jgi:hypothetical protein
MFLLKQDFIYFFIYDAENAIYKFRPTNFSLHNFDIIKTMHFVYLSQIITTDHRTMKYIPITNIGVVVQDFVSGQACCVNQYHYESCDAVSSHNRQEQSLI